MKKLNSSWKVAGFALLFGLALQSCDDIIDNPLSPSQPIPDTPAEPAKPAVAISYNTKSWAKATTATITGCATTTDVNTLIAGDSIAKLLANATKSVEIVVKGGVKIDGAIAIPAAANAPEIQLTFEDAFTEAKKALTISNADDNSGDFTVKLPDSESAVDVTLTVSSQGAWSNTTLTGNALVGTLAYSAANDGWRELVLKPGIKIAKYDDSKILGQIAAPAADIIDAVVLNDGDNKEYNKNGFDVSNIYIQDSEDEIRAKNAIVAEGAEVWVYPKSRESNAGTITVSKNAKLHLNEGCAKKDNDDNKWYSYGGAEKIVGAEGAVVYGPVAAEDWGNGLGRFLNYGSIEDVTLDDAWKISSNVKNSTVKSNVNVFSAATFDGCTFSDGNINMVTYASSTSYTLYVWQDTDGKAHYTTTDPTNEASYDPEHGYWTQYVSGISSTDIKDVVLTFKSCKRGADALTNINLAPIVGSAIRDYNSWNTISGTTVKYDIDGTVYKKSSAALVEDK